jgi:hypothetical protein
MINRWLTNIKSFKRQFTSRDFDPRLGYLLTAGYKFNRREGETMIQKRKRCFILLYCLAAVVSLVACVPQTSDELQPEPALNPTRVVIEESRAQTENTLPAPAPTSEAPTTAPGILPAQQPDAPTPAMDPLAVTQSFYDWYIESIARERGSSEFRNLLVERAYLDNPLLTEAFKARVDEAVQGPTSASSERGGYDPFLLAQDIPQDMFAQSVTVMGDEARVTVLRNWGSPDLDAIFAHLQKVNDVWLLNDATPLELYEPSADTPEGTVQMFYAWYVDAVRRRFVDEADEGPAADADFHNSDLLTARFKQEIDDMRAQAEAEFPQMGLHADPFLCAQDVPYHVTPDQALIDGETAVLTARTSFQDQIILIELQSTGNGWLIDDVTCIASPQDTAKAFYTWYLGYTGNRHDGSFRNPLVNKAYQGQPLLSKTFVRQVDSMFDKADQRSGAHDPFLLAQDLPVSFNVEPGPEEGTAVVHLQFGEASIADLLLTMVQENGRWRIENVTQMST